MSVKFVRNDQIFDTELCLQGLNLLGHAQMMELFIGSQCGGHGICGADRVMLFSEEQKKVNALTEIEKLHLSEQDQALGVRLACQCFPNQDGLSLNISLDIDKPLQKA